MKQREYLALMEFKSLGTALMPLSQKARQMCEMNRGSVLLMQEKTQRDLKFHRAYFSLLRFIYSWLPNNFKEAVSEKHFYQWLKHLSGKYEILYRFKDGTCMVEYESISFARMTQATFKDYVREQLSLIYEYLIHEICQEPEMIIDTIEHEFESYLEKL